MQDRILSFFGMSRPSKIESKLQDKKSFEQKRRYQFGIMRQQQHQGTLMKLQSQKMIQVPKQYENQLYAFKSQKNLYLFPNELPQGYQRFDKLLPYSDSIKTNFIFVIIYQVSTDQSLPQVLNQNYSYQFQPTYQLNIEYIDAKLVQCRIQNLQNLSFLDAPSLRNLYLDQNLIICIKPLIKAKFCLSVLSICNLANHVQNNRVKQFDLCRFHMKQNAIGPTLNLILHDIFQLQSSFLQLFKIQSPLIDISDGKKTSHNNYFRNQKYTKMLQNRFLGLNFTLQGIRTCQQLIESKYEYIYYQKLQKRRDTNFLLHQF